MAAFEIEWYGSRFVADPNMAGSPFAGIPDEYSDVDDWKWSFYLKFSPSNINKKILPGFAVKGLVARDHYRTEDNGGNFDPQERMRAPENWHYTLRLEYSF
jgi:hypothetical protein